MLFSLNPFRCGSSNPNDSELGRIRHGFCLKSISTLFYQIHCYKVLVRKTLTVCLRESDEKWLHGEVSQCIFNLSPIHLPHTTEWAASIFNDRAIRVRCLTLILTRNFFVFPRKCPKSMWKRFPDCVIMMLSLWRSPMPCVDKANPRPE